MTEQKRLFKELEFNRVNVERWAEEQVLKEPTVTIYEEEVPNSVERVLRGLLYSSTIINLNNYDKSELVEEALNYIMNGVDKPYCDMTKEELLDNIENWDFETMDDLIAWVKDNEAM